MSITFSIALPRDPIASSLARQAVRSHLAGHLPSATLADVTLAVSELVANAVLHGTGAIELRMEADDQAVKGEVIDQGRGFERQMREDGGLDGVGGRGLFIVGKLAESWGVHEGTTHVWFEIPVGGADQRCEDPDVGYPGEDQLPDV
jgi:anti-sigma regulatory factor (Ser/Thr protein kinase)